MKVLYNVEALLSPPLTGVGHYARHILAGLLSQGAGVDVTCFANMRPVPPPLPGYDGLGEAPPPRQIGPLKRFAASLPGVRRLRDAVREQQDRWRFAGTSAAIYHEPNHIAHPLRCRTVVTIHDLSVLHYPEMHPPERVRYFESRLRDTAARADRIITGSAFIKRDIVATLGVPEGKIDVVPYGVGPEFYPMPPTETRPVLDNYGLRPGGYLLAVGTIEPRKNLERLLEAYLGLPASMRAEWTLVLAGPSGWRVERLEEQLAHLERDGVVRRLGYVPDAHRTALYAGAAGFAYPSLYEGFGLPPLEAAACGAPVLTSAGSPMAEVLGQAALLIDPLDVTAIGAGLERLLGDPNMARAARRVGPALAAKFGWPASVDGTMAAYRQAAAG